MFYVSNKKTSILGVYVISNKTKYVVFTVCSKQAITRQVLYVTVSVNVSSSKTRTRTLQYHNEYVRCV